MVCWFSAALKDNRFEPLSPVTLNWIEKAIYLPAFDDHSDPVITLTNVVAIPISVLPQADLDQIV